MDALRIIEGKEVFIIAIIFIIAMTLYGHNRGFIRMAVSCASIILTLIIVNIASPYVSDYISENPAVQGYIQERVGELVLGDGFGENDEEPFEDKEGAFGGAENPDVSSYENEGPGKDAESISGDEFIRSLPIPELLKEKLEKDNTEDIYELLGVDRVTDYVAASLSKLAVKAIVFVVLFILVSIALRIAAKLLSLFARLPVICGMNQLAGAGLGFVESIFIIWLIMLLVPWLPIGEYSGVILDGIAASDFLSFLYSNNLISVFLLSLFGI